LDFNPDDEDEASMDENPAVHDEDDDVEMERSPVLTKQELQKWQKALLEVLILPYIRVIVVSVY
jgi:hypothetical protein